MNLISALFRKSTFFISLYHKGRTLDKKNSLCESGVGKGDTLLASLSSGKPKIFKRFRGVSTSYWHVVSSWDAIVFKFERALLIMGFAVF